MMPELALSCPVCREPLQRDQAAGLARCAAGHSFDRARQGYWNLLLAQRKKSKDPGDNSDMVQARKRFLDGGFYAPIAEQLDRMLIEALSDQASPEPTILDLGCGEGYYTAHLEQSLLGAGMHPALAGLDISKHAVRAACQRSKGIHWLVATGADIPLAPATLDAMLMVFSRVLPEPMARVMKPGAPLLLVWPGPEHLLELRELIYSEVRNRGYDPAPELAPWFDSSGVETLQFRFEVPTPQAISDLLAMTPHGQRVRPEVRERITAQPGLSCRADIRLALFRRRGPTDQDR